jgi:hypothetical protein
MDMKTTTFALLAALLSVLLAQTDELPAAPLAQDVAQQVLGSAIVQPVQPLRVNLQARATTQPPSQGQTRRQSVPKMPADAAALLRWVRTTADNEGAPFVIIDKRKARLWLFDARAEPLGNSAVLLGLARGDASVPGIGERPMAQILAHERTTPAGRFITEPGRNTQGEDIFWVDYVAAVSMHRVRATNPAERRLQRLATPTARDNRISYGCINVPAAFYDQLLRPSFAGTRSVVYLLPESVPLHSLFTDVHAPGAQVAGHVAARTARAAALRH